MATLLSLNVGMPEDVPWQGRTVHTGVWKYPVAGKRVVRRLNVDGDGQGDLRGHGGEQRAVLVYQIDSYAYWERQLARDEFEFGQFGENFTVEGLPDDEVCIGDRYRVGEAEFEVTQPRVTCYRVGMRLGEPRMASLLVAHHRPGFYLRVVEEGRVEAGDEIVRTRSGPGALTVAETDALLYLPDRDPRRLRAALDVPALSPGWRQSFDALVNGGPDGAEADAGSRATEPGWAGFRPLRVVSTVRETPSVLSVRLAAEDGGALPAPRAGQYLTLRVNGAGDPAPVRSYSLSSGPDADDYRISVKREDQGVVSRYLHRSLKPGAVLGAAAPRGDFTLAPGEGPVLLVSAGIGVTPLLSMLYELAAEESDRPVWWIHTARSPAEHAFADEAHRLLGSLGDSRECVFYTGAYPEGELPEGVSRGRPTEDALRALGLPAEATAYLCGPDAFMAAMRESLGRLGIDPGAVHSEAFGALETINPGVVGHRDTPPHQPPGEPGTGPVVTFARSGLSVRWPAGRRSLLDLADACDVPTRYACRTGVCHTCATRMIAGEVEYRPAPLEPPAAGEVLICCARPGEDVVIDL
ncbi:MOSC domain-containing protein [Streptomyces sp. DW26H14]|uniref:MOSC domain-containing protein n=1 Tax=Streptomyces sp. DW26H14 TaxID=3435395 RepID=UPI00403E0A02